MANYTNPQTDEEVTQYLALWAPAYKTGTELMATLEKNKVSGSKLHIDIDENEFPRIQVEIFSPDPALPIRLMQMPELKAKDFAISSIVDKYGKQVELSAKDSRLNYFVHCVKIREPAKEVTFSSIDVERGVLEMIVRGTPVKDVVR